MVSGPFLIHLKLLMLLPHVLIHILPHKVPAYGATCLHGLELMPIRLLLCSVSSQPAHVLELVHASNQPVAVSLDSLLHASLCGPCVCKALSWLARLATSLGANPSLGSWPMLLLECVGCTRIHFHIWIKSKSRHTTSSYFVPTLVLSCPRVAL